MKKFVKKFLSVEHVIGFVLLAIAGTVLAVNYTWTKRPAESQAIGFGAVIGEDGTGAIAISSCDGMASVNAANACQIGTGDNTTAESFQYRSVPILEAQGVLGIGAYGNMRLKYAIYAEEWMDAGYVANVTSTLSSALPGTRFAEQADRAEYFVYNVDGGGDNAETITIADQIGGWLEIVNNNAAADSTTVMLNGEPAGITDAKQFWFRASYMVEDADQDDSVVGVVNYTATNTPYQAFTDGIYFQNDGDGNLDWHVVAGSTNTTGDTGVDLADATAVAVAAYFDGVETITISVDGDVITNLVATAAIPFPMDATLTPIIAKATEDTGADYLKCDYIGTCSER